MGSEMCIRDRVDPVQGINCIFLTQLVPSGTHIKLRWDLRALVNQAVEEKSEK